jgi:hypothetical protein
VGSIRCPYRRCENKKFLDLDIVTIHLLQKRFMERYMCWFAHTKSYVPHEHMVQKMIW